MGCRRRPRVLPRLAVAEAMTDPGHLPAARDVDLGPGGWEMVAEDLRPIGELMRAFASSEGLRFWASDRYPCVRLQRRRWTRRYQASLCLDLPAVGDRDVAQMDENERRYEFGSHIRVLGGGSAGVRGYTKVATFTAAELRSGEQEVTTRFRSALERVVSSWSVP